MTLTKKEISDRYYGKKKQERINQTLILEEGETYVKINGNEKYYLTNKGRVYSTLSCKFLKPLIYKKTGYTYFTLSERKSHCLHRLLGLHFIPNPDNLPVIDHIDRNRQNNSFTNLRWASYSDNSKNRCKGSISERRDKRNGKVYQYWRVYYYDDEGKHSKSFKSYDEALSFHKQNKL
jgi:hypothetical protein